MTFQDKEEEGSDAEDDKPWLSHALKCLMLKVSFMLLKPGPFLAHIIRGAAVLGRLFAWCCANSCHSRSPRTFIISRGDFMGQEAVRRRAEMKWSGGIQILQTQIATKAALTVYVQWQLATCDPNYETGVANTIPPAWLLLHPLMTDL